MTTAALLAAIFFPLVVSPLFLLLQKMKGQNLGLVSAVIASISLACVLMLWARLPTQGSLAVMIPWAPNLGVNLSFVVDGLSLFFGILVTGMGVLVNFYANFYMDSEEEGIGRFYTCLTFFMGSMLGAIFSDNLMLLYLFWELTGIASYLLIGYNRDSEEASGNARLALLVTFFTGFFFFIGIILVGILDGTYRLSEIVDKGINFSTDPIWGTMIAFFFLIGILGKSAQAPFHFWLPKAMVAPIPVSSYLHAATMVKLGIYLTARVYPILVTSDIWYPLLTSVCYATMLFGAVFSLLANDLKGILAYATISQLGFFIGFYGMGGEEGVRFDFVHIFNHALYKGSLFMLVGIITKATGIRDIRYLGGLWNKLPLTTFSFFLAAGAMAGVPGTTGFLSKELILSDILGREWTSGMILIFVLLMTALVFKVAFSARLFFHLFVRQKGVGTFDVKRPSLLLQMSPLILSSAAFVFGVWPVPLEFLTGSFFVSSLHLQQPIDIELLHGPAVETFVSLGILAAGGLLFYAAERSNLWWADHKVPDWGGFWEKTLDLLPMRAEAVTRLVHPSKRNVSIALLLIAFAAACAVPFNSSRVSLDLLAFDTVRLAISALVVISAFATAAFHGPMVKLLSLSISGFFVTLYFVFFAAPDLAMTQILVEVITLVILVMVFSVTRGDIHMPLKKLSFVFRVMLSSAVGLAAAWAAWAFHSNPLTAPLPPFFFDNSVSLARGKNLVNLILVDYRGLDTLGETAVLFIAAIGVWGMLRMKTDLLRDIALIPSAILKALVPHIFVLINVLALYLLMRGHNHPGGGFIAGLATGISMILLCMIYQTGHIITTSQLNLTRVGAIGLLLASAVALFPLLNGQMMLTHYVWNVPTPLLFDVGVYLAVVGVVLRLFISLRARLTGDQ